MNRRTIQQSWVGGNTWIEEQSCASPLSKSSDGGGIVHYLISIVTIKRLNQLVSEIVTWQLRVCPAPERSWTDSQLSWTAASALPGSALSSPVPDRFPGWARVVKTKHLGLAVFLALLGRFLLGVLVRIEGCICTWRMAEVIRTY